MLSDSAARGSAACTGVALAVLAVTMGLSGCGDTPAPASKLADIDLVCIGPRAHTCDWKVDADSKDKIENATIKIQPDPARNKECAKLIESSRLEHPLANGDKFICVGANVDDTCTHAREDIELVKDHLDCPNCFAGLTMDLSYTLKFSYFMPQEISLGVKNAHIYGAAELHVKGDKSKYSGNITLEDVKKSIKFPAGGIIPFHIDFDFPTTLHYDVDVPKENFTAGYDLDVNFGDHIMTWTKGKDFTFTKTENPTVTVTPKLEGTVDQHADLKVSVDSNLALDASEMVSLKIKANTDVPLSVDLVEADKNVCFTAQATAKATHEENVKFTLFGKDHEVYASGPKTIFDLKTQVHKCLPVPMEDLAMVV